MVSKDLFKEETESRSISPIKTALDALKEATGREPIKTSDGWKACCPAHDDQNPSLSVSQGNDGRALIHCLAGCQIDDVLAALRLERRDLFLQTGTAGAVQHDHSRLNPTTQPTILTRRSASTSQSWPVSADVISALERKLGSRSFAWTYRDADRKEVGIIVRWDQPDGRKEIRPIRLTPQGWQIGAMPEPRPLYRLADIVGAGIVFVVEGEKAALAADSLGLDVTTSAGGSKAANKTDWSPLASKEVVILPDNDGPGRHYAEAVAGILSQLKPPPTVRIADLRLLWAALPTGGDIADFCEAHESSEPETLRQQILTLADQTEPLDFRDVTEPSQPLPVGPQAVLERFSEIERERVQWLWPGRIPLGMLTVVSGNPGQGKSLLMMDIAARVTTGNEWPDGSRAAEPGDVILINVEDAVAAVQGPRLDAAGADVNRVIRIKGMAFCRDDAIIEEKTFSIREAADVLRSALDQLDRPKLIVLDPLAAFLATVRSNDQGDIRAALSPLVALAEETGIAIVFVHHNRKGTGNHASERLAGSLQIGATVRQSWEVVIDPDDSHRRLWLPGKNSNAKSCGGLAFRIVDSSIPLSDEGDFVGRVEWEPGIVDLSADDVARIESDEEARDPFPVVWLRDYLSDGSKPAKEISAAAANEGISKKQLRSAKSRLRVRTRKQDFSGGWVWELPADHGRSLADSDVTKAA